MYESLCEGVRSCEVPNGNYNGINHHTGKRFEGIEVSGVGNIDGVVVEGNTIRWPDNGYHQVQHASTYESLFEDVQFCEVPDGTYIVINHSSGKRFEGVKVP